MDQVAFQAHERLLTKIREGLQDKRRRAALYLGTEGVRETSEQAYSNLPESESFLREARRIKREAIENLDQNLSRFIHAAESSGAKVYLAKDAASAVQIVLSIARNSGAKRIVKSKSMTSEEIELRQHLEHNGYGVIETDLGERIVQIANQRPSHLVAPALHMSVEEIAELFSKQYGRRIPPDPEQITTIARDSLREIFLTADIGITGANFAVADSGSLVIVTNEGNARLVTALPPITIATLGVEKIVGNIADALNLLQALVLSATGQRMTSYVTLVKGRSRLARNAHQPEQHIIILDNGRSAMRPDPVFREALYCIRCGACNDICPTFRLFGGHVFGHIYTGPIGIPWTEYTAPTGIAGALAPLCISCGLCQHACPEDIDIPFLIAKVKEAYVNKHGQLSVNRTLVNYEKLVSLASATAPLSNFMLRRRVVRRLAEKAMGIDARRPFPKFTRHTFKKWFRSHVSVGSRPVAYFVDTYADLCDPEIGKAVVGILEENDCRVSVPEQVGSGMPAFLYGDLRPTRDAAEFNVKHLAEAVRCGSEVVSSEPTATYCLKELYPRLLGTAEAELVAAHSRDLFDFLLRLHRDGKLRLEFPQSKNEPAAYYSPCHTRSVYGKSPALQVLMLAGVDLQTVRYNTCCGIAGTFGYKKGAEGYDVSMAIGETLLDRIKATNLQLVVTESSVCKMQIEFGTGLPVLHPATALWSLYESKD